MPPEREAATLVVLAERLPDERRVALVPREIAKLSAKVRVMVEAGAGAEAGFSDDDYRTAGAMVGGCDQMLAAADIAVAVRAPERLAGLRTGATLISLGAHNAELAATLLAQGINHLGLERLPRITRAQSMDVLSSQATVAGYAAVIAGAQALDTLMPMLTTAAGSIKPARMIALGAGVAGLQAIATARRLGAVAHGFDVRAAAREQVESLGAKFVFPDTSVPSSGVPNSGVTSSGPPRSGPPPSGLTVAEAAGGYASDQTVDQQAVLRRALTPALADMQLVVTSAQIPGRPAPILIDDETLAAMTPGAVIVDLAAETGGNTTRTKADGVVTVGRIRILGSTHLPSLMATDASRLFSNNLRALLDHLLDEDGHLRLSRDDAITDALLGAPPIVKAA